MSEVQVFKFIPSLGYLSLRVKTQREQKTPSSIPKLRHFTCLFLFTFFWNLFSILEMLVAAAVWLIPDNIRVPREILVQTSQIPSTPPGREDRRSL